jgi:hypothetical protein
MARGGRPAPRICILRHAAFPADPRVRKHVETLIEDGWSVDVICLREPGDAPRERWQGATIYRAPVRHKRRNVIRYAFEYGAFLLIAAVYLG